MAHTTLTALSTLEQVRQGLRSSPKSIPYSLLYDPKGSDIFGEITQLEEYYPYIAESRLLELHAPHIARTIPLDCLIVELGCGSATKSAHLLNALQALHGRCKYVGIDVSRSFLEQAHKNLLKNVQGLRPSSLHFVEGEFMEALAQVRKMFSHELFCVMWIGNTVGNLEAEDAVSFMKEVLRTVGPKCLFFLSVDQCEDTNIIYKAYHDEKGINEMFIKNGMKKALSLLGHAVNREEENRWLYHLHINPNLRRVEAWVTFPDGLHIEEHHVHIRPHESVFVASSKKFNDQDLQELATKSNFYIQEAWHNKMYGCQMLYSGLQALLSCWQDTDTLFDRISDWNATPMDLTHPFIFYYGHINVFTKVKLLTNDDIQDMDAMFLTCHHNHPKATPKWPSRVSVCAYVSKVRSMVMKAMEHGTIPMPLICCVLEHDRVHREALAYLVTEVANTLSGSGPNFRKIVLGELGRGCVCVCDGL